MKIADQAAHADPKPTPRIEIGPLRSAQDAIAFGTLNEEWISRLFTLEDKDCETLGDPHNTILAKGGHIYMVHADGVAIGCVALIPTPAQDGTYELSKMAISPTLRGLGIGRRLLEYTIAQAREIGAKSLFLGSST